MSLVIVKQHVNNYSTWKPLYDEDRSRRESAGLKEIKVGQQSDDPHCACIVWETEKPEQIDAMFKDPELQKKMREAGVTGKTDITIVN